MKVLADIFFFFFKGQQLLETENASHTSESLPIWSLLMKEAICSVPEGKNFFPKRTSSFL